MKKDFIIQIVTKDSRRVLVQHLVTFGSEERPVPEDWENDAVFQVGLYEYGDNLLRENFDVVIEEGESFPEVEKPYSQSEVDEMIKRAEEREFDRGVEVGQNISNI